MEYELLEEEHEVDFEVLLGEGVGGEGVGGRGGGLESIIEMGVLHEAFLGELVGGLLLAMVLFEEFLVLLGEGAVTSCSRMSFRVFRIGNRII